MKRFAFRLWLYLAIDCAVLAVCLLHVPSLIHRATTPFEVEKREGQLVVRRLIDAPSSAGMKEGDVVLRWRDQNVAAPEAFEFLADLSSIGDTVRIASLRDGHPTSSLVRLIPFYPSLRFVIITIFVGMVMWGVGIYVLWNGWRELAGRILHWMMISFAAVVMLTWGAVTRNTLEMIVRPIVFLISYEIGVPLFFYFTTLYPKRKEGSIAFIGTATFLPAAVILAGSTYYLLRALSLSSAGYFNSFQSVYDVFHAALLVYVGGGIVNLIHSYITAVSLEERQRSKWILWGFVVGAIPFMLLYILPLLLFSSYLIDEEYVTIFFLVIPFSFAVSFIKYKLFDIEVLINRSIVYSVLTVFIVAAYVLIVLLLTSLIRGQAVFEEYLYLVAVTLAVAWLINPLRRRIQRLVDESLFAARTNFRDAITEMTGALHSALSAEELFRKLVECIQRLVPSEMIAVYTAKNDALTLGASSGTTPRGPIPLTRQMAGALMSSRVIALPQAVSYSDEGLNLSQSECLREMDCSVCVPMKTESGEIGGAVVLRARSSRERYDEDEIDFLLTLSTQSAEVLERLLLQERIILERQAKHRFEELSDIKSEFVSYVSHELRTPLTSIKMFSDLLKRRLPPRDVRATEYLDIIDGESDRLSRMVSNILDASRIDEGVKEYSFTDVDLGAAAQSVLETMKYQFKKYGFRVDFQAPKRKVMIRADADAVAQAIINLVGNSIKYSTKRRLISVRVSIKKKWALCSVTDRGDGISKEAIPHLFQKFYREPTHSAAVQGVGLGLPLVKHIMEAHDGRVEVRSEPGRGSVFTIFFPAKKSTR